MLPVLVLALSCAAATASASTTPAPTSTSLSAWQALFTSTKGGQWKACSKNKNSPCACPRNTCNAEKTVIVSCKLVNNNMQGTVTNAIIGNLIATGTTTIDFSKNGKLKTPAGQCIDMEAVGCLNEGVTCTFPNSVVKCTTGSPTTEAPTSATEAPVTMSPTTTTPVPTTAAPTTAAPTTAKPTVLPTVKPTTRPTPPGFTPSPTTVTAEPSAAPISSAPSGAPVEAPTVTLMPTAAPTMNNTNVTLAPSTNGTNGTLAPTQPPQFFSSAASTPSLAGLAMSAIAAVVMGL